MKFGGFKLGKSKEKEGVLEETVEQTTDEAVPEIPLDAEPVAPHAPLQELSLDAPEGEANGEAAAAAEGGVPAEEAGEPIKLVEVQPAASAEPVHAPPPPPSPAPAAAQPAAKKDGGGLDLASSISNIFNNTDEEENPLSNLIRVLPDVAATELIDDLKEINDIIKDWQKK